MADILSTVWSETDASNTSTGTQPGWPEGMPGANVNNAARAMQGAIKRFADQISATRTTAGTGSAYTVDYTVAPDGLYNGQRFCVLAHAACLAAPTLNINSLGARTIRKLTGTGVAALAANDIVVNSVLDLVYVTALSQFLWLNAPVSVASGSTVPAHTHAQSDITNLTTDLAGKASDAELTAAITTEVALTKTATYVLAAADAGKMVTFNSASGVSCTVNSSIFAAGNRVDVLQLGAGQVTFDGTALRRANPSGANKLTGQYSGATIWFISATEYALLGNIVV